MEFGVGALRRERENGRMRTKTGLVGLMVAPSSVVVAAAAARASTACCVVCSLGSVGAGEWQRRYSSGGRQQARTGGLMDCRTAEWCWDGRGKVDGTTGETGGPIMPLVRRARGAVRTGIHTCSVLALGR